MSTDLHQRTPQPTPPERPEQPDKPKPALSVAQVAGGALAAMTAAALGSRLSVAGTVVGAALASVVAAVAGAVYTASLRRTSRHVNAVLTRVRPTATGATPTFVDGATATTTLPSTTVAPDGSDWVLPAGAEQPPIQTLRSSPRSRTRWKPVLVGALLMFLIAVLALTGLELATGHALSGGRGTTVGEVADPGTRPSATSTGSAPSEPSTTPSATASAAPSATPSVTPSATPSAEPTAGPSGAPSATPSATPAQPSATPTAAGTSPALSPAG